MRDREITALSSGQANTSCRNRDARQRRRSLCLVLMALFLGGMAASSAQHAAAETESDFFMRGPAPRKAQWNSWRARYDRMNRPVRPVNNTFRTSCSKCHFLYQPWLLPARSWSLIMSGTKSHFGVDLALAPETSKEIEKYLTAYAADRIKVRNEWTLRILKSSRGITPASIHEVPYIKKKHAEIPADVFARPYIKNISNCGACHRWAFRDDYRGGRIPGPH